MKDLFQQPLTVESIVLACLVKAGTGKNIHRDRPSHGVALFTGSESTIAFEGGPRLILRGPSLVYFPKHSGYTITEATSADWYAINFQLAGQPGCRPFSLSLPQPSPYRQRFAEAANQWTTRHPGFEHRVAACLYDIFYLAQNQLVTADSPSHHQLLKPALDHIHAHYLTQPISVEDLARLCNISPVYLRRLFQQHFDTSPSRYIKILRLEKARELMLSGIYSAAEVCFLSGFRDESHFSREFKRHYGQPPKEYALTAGSTK